MFNYVGSSPYKFSYYSEFLKFAPSFLYFSKFVFDQISQGILTSPVNPVIIPIESTSPLLAQNISTVSETKFGPTLKIIGLIALGLIASRKETDVTVIQADMPLTERISERELIINDGDTTIRIVVEPLETTSNVKIHTC